MTSTRLISGIVFFTVLLIGLFQPVFMWLPPLVVAAAMVLGIREFVAMGREQPSPLHLSLSIVTGLALLADGYFYSLDHAVLILGITTVATIAAGLTMEGSDIVVVAGRAVAGPLYVALPLAFILRLWQDNLDPTAEFPNAGAHYILFLIFGTWASDVGAYFAGRKFGKTKIVPRLSPGKTLEGYIGGMIFTFVTVVALKLGWNNIDVLFGWVDIIVLMVGFSILGPMGDLAESQLKRAAQVKDSGLTFTGHGGMLDIIDSLLFTTVFYIAYLAIFHPSAFAAAPL